MNPMLSVVHSPNGPNLRSSAEPEMRYERSNAKIAGLFAAGNQMFSCVALFELGLDVSFRRCPALP